MITRLEGTLLEINPGEAVISVNGVGYQVRMTSDTLVELKKQLNQEVIVRTHLSVREDSHDLYGFVEKDELEFFELLITIPGIGPKSALAILSAANPETIRQAVALDDPEYLTKASGIGRKTAEKIVRELEGKVGAIAKGSERPHHDGDAVEGLTALGYSEREAREALKKIPAEIVGVSKRITEALRLLGKK